MAGRDGVGAPRDGAVLGGLVLLGATAVVASTRLLPLIGEHLADAGSTGTHLLAFVWAGVLGVTILAWPVPERLKPHLIACWSIKVLVTVGLMLAYEARYPFVDGYGYYRAASAMQGLGVSGFGNGTGLVESLIYAHLAVLPDGYQVVKISFSFLGFAGLYLGYRTAVVVTGRDRPGLLYLFLLFPSLLFWTSTLGKDPLALLGIAMYALGIADWWRRGRRRGLALALAGTLIAAAVRLWLGPILLLPALYLALRRGGRGPGLLYGALAAGLAWWVTGVLMARFGIGGVDEAIAFLSRWSQAWARGGSAQTLEPFRDIGDLLAFLPLGMFTALFRPLPGEIGHLFGLLAGAENAVLLLLVLLALARRTGASLRDPLLAWLVLVVLAWSVVYAFLSYQNLGTGARFRVQILPLLLVLIVARLGPGRAGGEPPKEVGAT